MTTFIFFCLALIVSTMAKVSYSGHRLYSVGPVTEEQAVVLETLREYALYKVDFWSSSNPGSKVDIHIPPEFEDEFINLLNQYGVAYEVAIEDIQGLIDEEETENQEARNKRDLQSYNIVGTFATTTEMDAFMQNLTATYKHVSLTSMGKSFEGRDQFVLKIADGRPGKKSIWVDAGIHAREWLSQSTTIWMMNEIVTKYGSDATITDLVNHYDWYFIPNVNPDGYEYSQNEDRLWRKTRSTGNSIVCAGTDANRNFDYPVFGGAKTSSNPCSDVYKGPHAFSEPEVANLRDFVMSIKDDLAMFITIHAYSQLLLTPWAYTATRPSDYVEMDRVAKIGANALYNVHGKEFQVGSPANILYAAGGGSYDWAKGSAGVKYAYAYEVRPSGANWDGFVVPPSEIQPSGEEILASITAMADAIKS